MMWYCAARFVGLSVGFDVGVTSIAIRFVIGSAVKIVPSSVVVGADVTSLTLSNVSYVRTGSVTALE